MARKTENKKKLVEEIHVSLQAAKYVGAKVWVYRTDGVLRCYENVSDRILDIVEALMNHYDVQLEVSFNRDWIEVRADVRQLQGQSFGWE